MADFEYPEDLRYTAEHEWVRVEGDRARVGITAYAQDALGDIVFVTLPDEGSTVDAGAACGEVESTKSVSDLYAPVSGTVVGAQRGPRRARPELVNSDPYGEGWMFEVEPADPAARRRPARRATQYRDQLRLTGAAPADARGCLDLASRVRLADLRRRRPPRPGSAGRRRDGRGGRR